MTYLLRFRVDKINGGCFVCRPAVNQRISRVWLRPSVSCEMVVFPAKENLEGISVGLFRAPFNDVRDLLGVGDIPLINEPGEVCCRRRSPDAYSVLWRSITTSNGITRVSSDATHGPSLRRGTRLKNGPPGNRGADIFRSFRY